MSRAVRLTKFKSRPPVRKDPLAYLMILPMLIGLFMFLVYPIVWVLLLSFYEYNGVTRPLFVGLDNFVRLFTREEHWWGAVANSGMFTLGKLILEIPCALVLAVILNQKLRGKYFFRIVFFLPSVLSSAVIALIFSHILSPYQGFLNVFLVNIGLLKEPIDWLGLSNVGMTIPIIISSWQYFGFIMMIFLAGLQRIPLELYESAVVDGANKPQQFFRITIPMLGKMLQVIVMLEIIGCLKAFDLIWILTRGGPGHQTEVMMTYIYKSFFISGEAQMYIAPQLGFGASMAFLAAIIIGAVTAVYLYSTKKMGEF